MKRTNTILILLVILVSFGCSTWKGAYIQFKDGFYKEKLTEKNILFLPVRVITVEESKNGYEVNYANRTSKGMLLQSLLQSQVIEPNKKFLTPTKTDKENLALNKQLNNLQNQVIMVNHTQNMVPLNLKKVGGFKNEKELFVNDLTISPRYYKIANKYNSNLAVVSYVFTSLKFKDITCISLVDLANNKIIYRVFYKANGYADIQQLINGVKKDLKL